MYGLFTGSEYCTVDWTFDSAFEWFKIVIPAEEAVDTAVPSSGPWPDTDSDLELEL